MKLLGALVDVATFASSALKLVAFAKAASSAFEATRAVGGMSKAIGKLGNPPNLVDHLGKVGHVANERVLDRADDGHRPRADPGIEADVG